MSGRAYSCVNVRRWKGDTGLPDRPMYKDATPVDDDNRDQDTLIGRDEHFANCCLFLFAASPEAEASQGLTVMRAHA